MDSDTETFCNSNKNHLQLQLEQPTPFADDIRHLDTLSNPDEDEEKEKVNEGEEEEVVDGEDTKTLQSALTKIPLLYQLVEPGCTPLSCYSAIATFIVMTLGIFWLLLISPPKNAVPMTVLPATANLNQVYDYQDSYDSSYSTLMPEAATTTAKETTTEILPLDEAVQDAPKSLVLGDS